MTGYIAVKMTNWRNVRSNAGDLFFVFFFSFVFFPPLSVSKSKVSTISTTIYANESVVSRNVQSNDIGECRRKH